MGNMLQMLPLPLIGLIGSQLSQPAACSFLLLAPGSAVKAGVFSQEQFSATSLFKLIFTLVSLSIIKMPSLGNIELVKLFYTV